MELTVTGSYAGVGGRPSKYPENAVQIIDEYLDWCVEHERVPFKEMLRTKKYFNISAETWQNWEEQFPEFLEASKRIEEVQRFQLQETSLRGKSNVIAAIFQLKVNHGMIETEKRINQNEGNITFAWATPEQQVAGRPEVGLVPAQTQTKSDQAVIEAEVLEVDK